MFYVHANQTKPSKCKEESGWVAIVCGLPWVAVCTVCSAVSILVMSGDVSSGAYLCIIEWSVYLVSTGRIYILT